jgi:cell division protein FtsB
MARKRNRVSHGKEAFYIICILALLLIGLFTYLGPGGWRELKKSQAELKTQRERVESLSKENEERQNSINMMRDDKETQERYARRKGYGRKGEIIQEVPSREPAPPQKSAK